MSSEDSDSDSGYSSSTPDDSSKIFHHEYADASADTVIFSADGQRFYIQSYYLKAHSTFFRNVLENDSLVPDGSNKRKRLSAVQQNPSTSSAVEGEALVLEVPRTGKTILTLLNFMTKAAENRLEAYDDLVSFLEVCGVYGCVFVEHFALKQLLERTVTVPSQIKHPWNLFRLASRYQDCPLAKNALRLMHQDKKHKEFHTDMISKDMSAGCEHGYYIGFIRAATHAFGNQPVTGERIGERLRTKWEKIANEFQPIQ